MVKIQNRNFFFPTILFVTLNPKPESRAQRTKKLPRPEASQAATAVLHRRRSTRQGGHGRGTVDDGDGAFGGKPAGGQAAAATPVVGCGPSSPARPAPRVSCTGSTRDAGRPAPALTPCPRTGRPGAPGAPCTPLSSPALPARPKSAMSSVQRGVEYNKRAAHGGGGGGPEDQAPVRLNRPASGVWPRTGGTRARTHARARVHTQARCRAPRICRRDLAWPGPPAVRAWPRGNRLHHAS